MDRGYVLSEDELGNPLIIRGIVIDVGFQNERLGSSEALIALITQSTIKKGSEVISTLTLCSNCKKARKDHMTWLTLSSSLIELLGEIISHGICPDCIYLLYPDLADSVIKNIKMH
jgi:hypothetical protein